MARQRKTYGAGPPGEEQKRHEGCAHEGAERYIAPRVEDSGEYGDVYEYGNRAQGYEDADGGGHAFAAPECEIEGKEVAREGGKGDGCDHGLCFSCAHGQPCGEEPLEYVTQEREDPQGFPRGPHHIGRTYVAAAHLPGVSPLQLGNEKAHGQVADEVREEYPDGGQWIHPSYLCRNGVRSGHRRLRTDSGTTSRLLLRMAPRTGTSRRKLVLDRSCRFPSRLSA